MSERAYDMDIKELETFERMLREKLPKIKVGILGNKDTRKDSDSNATIGLFHEFGTENHEERSFLRMPIREKFPELVKSSGLLNRKSFEAEIKARSILGLARTIGMIGLRAVLEAFDTGGFGKWKASNMKYKKVQQTLVETQQLRDSITFEVERD